jgi:hypothetical protein
MSTRSLGPETPTGTERSRTRLPALAVAVMTALMLALQYPVPTCLAWAGGCASGTVEREEPGATVLALASLGAESVESVGLSVAFRVSHDGRFVEGVREGNGVTVDRSTGSSTVWGGRSPGMIRDNPELLLEIVQDLSSVGPACKGSLVGWFLTNTRTGVRNRIDTDSNGAALVSSQAGLGDGECTDLYFTDMPWVFLSERSISKDGQVAAFCANYTDVTTPVLYVKDLDSGRLTQTSLRCGVWDNPRGTTFGGRYVGVEPPTISDDGRVVHVNGDRGGDFDAVEYSLGDSLYFTESATTRSLDGWGEMTRDGGTVFMRVGVHQPGTANTTGDRVGAYDVRTGRTTSVPQLPAESVFGVRFSSFDQASRRGRYLIAPGGVYDRRTGMSWSLAEILTRHGYAYEPGFNALISGDGDTIIAPTRAAAGIYQVVAVTGWRSASLAVKAVKGKSKLHVDVNPNKGTGYWKFQVQRRRADGSWKALKTYRTKGSRETRTINLKKGTYRVWVKPKYDYQGALSAAVYMKK